MELFNTTNVYENDETMEIDVSSSRVRDRLARKLLCNSVACWFFLRSGKIFFWNILWMSMNTSSNSSVNKN